MQLIRLRDHYINLDQILYIRESDRNYLVYFNGGEGPKAVEVMKNNQTSEDYIILMGLIGSTLQKFHR